MKINILLPYKEKFNKSQASSVSITVKNSLSHSKFLKDIKIFGQEVENPLFVKNFIGLKYSFLSLKSKNKFLASKMSKIISSYNDKKQLIEIHNRPYLVDQIGNKQKFPISLFFHNDPQTMKGSKSIEDRQYILEKCSAVFCVSEYVKKKFLEGINKHTQKIYVLHNGVERKLKIFPKKNREILFVGRIVPEKGVELYIDVIKNIAKKFPDWKFHLIGSHRLGENRNTKPFTNKMVERFKKIGNQALFHGFKDQDFVQQKMKTASIIIIPSIWEEPFGLVAAEAMSNGIAIIASHVGGIPEIVKDNGVLIKDINTLKLKTALEE